MSSKVIQTELKSDIIIRIMSEKKENGGQDFDGDSLGFPAGTQPLDNQVAGHKFGYSANYLALLRHLESNDILKPICDKRSERELRLYSQVWDSDNDFQKEIQILRQFVPKFNGIFIDDTLGRKYLRLDDICKGMEKPSVLDIKVGPKTYDLEANDEKIFSETNKYRFAQQIGFRFLGMRVYNSKDNEYLVKDKDYGLKLTPEDIDDAIKLFVQNNSVLRKQFSSQIKTIYEWFQNYNISKWQFISSSLLLVYDSNQSKPAVKMIDFAHVFPNEGRDDNYLFGLKKLIQYFDSLYEKIY